MKDDIVYYVKNRYTAKAYDSSKKISDKNIEKIKELLRFSASSTNSQPWHFILASTNKAKEKIAKSTEQIYPANRDVIMNASHVVVFCSKLDIDEDYVWRIIEQEEKDGRFISDKENMKLKSHAGRCMFMNLHKQDYKDVQHWMDKQVYLNLGAFLLGVSTLGIDATPMEGIEAKIIDEGFGLRKKGYTSLIVVPIGYHDTKIDYNATLPKSRLPYSEILTEV